MLLSVLGITMAVFGLVLFGQAGVSKLSRPLLYQPIMQGYLGRPVSVWLVRAVGVIELDLGFALLFPATSLIAMYLCGALLLVYGLVMARQLAAGQRDMRCGCGGPASDTRVSSELVWRNVLVAAPFFALAAFNASVAFPFSLAELGVGGALALVFLFSYYTVDRLIANQQFWQGAQS